MKEEKNSAQFWSIVLRYLAIGCALVALIGALFLFFSPGNKSESQIGSVANSSRPASPAGSQESSKSGVEQSPAAEDSPASPRASKIAPAATVTDSPSLNQTFPGEEDEVLRQLKSAPGLEPVAAMKINGKLILPEMNTIGEFFEQNVETSALVPVAIRYPDGVAGQKVGITMEDGGKVVLDQKKDLSRVVQLDENLIASFLAEISPNDGIHRVTLRNGYDVRLLNFWAGPPRVFKNPQDFPSSN